MYPSFYIQTYAVDVTFPILLGWFASGSTCLQLSEGAFMWHVLHAPVAIHARTTTPFAVHDYANFSSPVKLSLPVKYLSSVMSSSSVKFAVQGWRIYHFTATLEESNSWLNIISQDPKNKFRKHGF